MHILLEFSRAHEAEKPDVVLDGPADYYVRTPGGGRENYTLDWAEWQEAVDALGAGDRSPGFLRTIGERLRVALRGIPLDAEEQAIVAASRRGERVAITIRSVAAEIARLPWELWVVKATGQHLAELENVLLRYTMPSAPAFRSGEDHPGGRGRVVVAYAGDVAAAEHIAAVQDAGEPIGFDHDRDVIARLSPRRLRDALDQARAQRAPIAVLHLLCHGTQDRDESYALVWAGDGDDGREVAVDGTDLGRILGNHADQVRLVVLSACHGSNAGKLGNRVGSVAQELHRRGIETVIGSRYSLSMDGSVAFARAFYGELLGRAASVEDALLVARRELALDPTGLDWARVQLYARPPEGEDGAGRGTHPLPVERTSGTRGPVEPSRADRSGRVVASARAPASAGFDALCARHAREGTTPEGALAVWFEAVLLYQSDDPFDHETGRRAIQHLTVPFKKDDDWDRRPSAHTFRERITRLPYIMHSYFRGTSPDRGYALPEGDRQLAVHDVEERREGTKVVLRSSGADQPRAVTMKQSTTTKLWYVHTFSSLYVGIRPPRDPDAEEFV